MKEIKTEIIISSKPEKIWNILTNFEKYTEWNPFIRSISGNKKVGEQLIVKIQPPNGSGMKFKPHILKYDQNEEFRWIGKLLFTGIFDGEHYFKMIDNHNGKTTFIQGEIFSGLLVNLLGKTLEKTRSGFDLMNKAIKKECEK